MIAAHSAPGVLFLIAFFSSPMGVPAANRTPASETDSTSNHLAAPGREVQTTLYPWTTARDGTLHNGDLPDVCMNVPMPEIPGNPDGMHDRGDPIVGPRLRHDVSDRRAVDGAAGIDGSGGGSQFTTRNIIACQLRRAGSHFYGSWMPGSLYEA